MQATDSERIIAARWAVPDPILLERIRSAPWTAHNIPLTATSSTMSDAPLIGDDNRTKIIKHNLRLFAAKDQRLAGLTVIDLGCLEGGLAFELAREDMVVTGVEGRAANYDKCQLISDYYGLPNLRFLHLDVKQLNRETVGAFDVILCCGLLYHLDQPVRFLRNLADIAHPGTVLFLDTHFAPVEQLDSCLYKHRLSGLDKICDEGVAYQGRWYHEYTHTEDTADLYWSAISNYQSFWPVRNDLIRALYHAGFQRIYDLYGVYEIEQEFDIRTQHSRLYCLAVKTTED